MTRYAAFALIGLTACATGQEVFGGRSDAGETRAVQVVTARWIASHYDPSDFLGTPKAICLVIGQAVGNRSLTATAQAARSEDMDPDPTLMDRLKDIEPEVLPISKCAHGDDLSEVIAATGERAIVLGIGHPRWVTPNLARISATLRENNRTWYSYACSVVREEEGWRLRRCT